MTGTKKHQRRRQWLHTKDPRCHWCKALTVIVALKGRQKQPDNMATLDHLDDRYSPERGKHWGKERTVLACHRCNFQRNVESERNQPIEVLRAKSQQHRPSRHIDEGMSP